METMTVAPPAQERHRRSKLALSLRGRKQRGRPRQHLGIPHCGSRPRRRGLPDHFPWINFQNAVGETI